MNTMKKLFLLLMLFSISSVIEAQTYEEWLKQEQSNFNKFRVEQEKMLQEMRDDYANYVKQHDKEYSDYLKKEWENFQVYAGKKPPEKPKPKAIPEFKQIAGVPLTRIPLLTAPL